MLLEDSKPLSKCLEGSSLLSQYIYNRASPSVHHTHVHLSGVHPHCSHPTLYLVHVSASFPIRIYHRISSWILLPPSINSQPQLLFPPFLPTLDSTWQSTSPHLIWIHRSLASSCTIPPSSFLYSGYLPANHLVQGSISTQNDNCSFISTLYCLIHWVPPEDCLLIMIIMFS